MPANLLLDKVPPYSAEAEMAVLGSMLIEKEALERSLEILDEKSFYHESHQRIFAAMRDLAANNKVVDVITIGEELRRIQALAEVGGGEYIVKLTNSVATAAHVEHYAGIVREKAVLRSLISAATQVVGECYQENESADALLDRAESLVYAIAEKKERGGPAPISEMLDSMVQYLEKLYSEKQQVTGVPTGFRKFDEMTSGLQKGNLIIFAARPGVGKTSFALNIAVNVAMEKKLPVLIFSLEMTRDELLLRILSSSAQIPLQQLRTGYFKKTDWPVITRKVEQLLDAPIYLDYSASAMSILTLRAAARRMATRLNAQGTPLALVIIDYLQLMAGSRRTPESRQTEIAEISRSLKAMARDLNIPIIALSQLNRAPEEKGREGRPQLSNLRESGALEQDADMVAFIYREGQYKKDTGDDENLKTKAKLIVAKQRNGPIGDVELRFIGEYAKFGDAETE